MAKQNRDSGRIRLRAGETPDAGIRAVKTDKTARRKVRRGNLPIVVLAAALLLLFVFSAGFLVYVSPEHRTLSYILELSREKLMRLTNFLFSGVAEGGIQFTFFRSIVIVLAGGCLAASGAVYNGAFRNILASPSVLGVQSGGGLGNLLYVLLFVSGQSRIIRYSEMAAQTESFTLLDRNLQQAMVMAGCFLAVFLVAGAATAIGRGRLRTSHLLLSGLIFSSVIGSFTGLVQYYLTMSNPADVRIEVIRGLSMGSFERAYTGEHVLTMLAFLLPCFVILMLLSTKMDALALGEEEAMALGLPVRRFRNFIIAVNTVMTAVIIAFCGQIGFVGFIVPQMARKLVGHKFRRLLPTSMILGAIMLLCVYDIAYLTGQTAYINLFTSAIGSVMMLIALATGKGIRRAAV